MVNVVRCRIENGLYSHVIDGGDFANDRIIPNCIRAVVQGRGIIVRNPYSARPYQHMLEPVEAYLMIALEQYRNREKYEANYNVGLGYLKS